MGRCLQAVYLPIQEENFLEDVPVLATPAPKLDQVGGLHLRPRPHTESIHMKIYVNFQYQIITSLLFYEI